MSVARLKPKAKDPDRKPGDELHVVSALRTEPELKGLVEYDEFAHRIQIARQPPWDGRDIFEPWSDQATTQLMMHLQASGYAVARRGVVEAAVAVVARDRTVHPVRKYLEACRAVWDGTQRIAWLWESYFGAAGDPKYLCATSRAFLISAVARVHRPGCKVDTTPVLESAQGAGKSSAVRILGEPWIAESLPTLGESDSALALQGVWIAEISELAAMNRSEVEQVKAYLSRQVDHYREPYARHFVQRPRQTVLVGTTNAGTYLKDHTGNRRFWPIKCGRIDLDGLKRDRDQLWGEAVHAFEADEIWHLTGSVERLAQEVQEQRRYVPELEVQTLAYLDRMRSQGHHELEMRQIIREVANVDSTDDPQRAGAFGSQIAAIMARNGWFAADTVGRGHRRRNLWRYDFGVPGVSTTSQGSQA
jgi:predicted P-loop ATPase